MPLRLQTAACQKKPFNPGIWIAKNDIFAARMILYIASLNSGSNGNCYYVGNGRESVLIDAGIPCRETERRMRRLGLSLSTVKAIFISHEHDDHIRGLEVLSKRYQLPVYISESTRQQLRFSLEPQLVRRLDPTEPVTTGELTVTPFPKTHDASDPCSFVVSSQAIRIGIFTDLGVVCEQLIRHFRQCHAAFLETNYDEQLLDNGRYPHFLKNRIRGGFGHLSNREALDLFVRHRPAFMSHLFPSHLSRDNNRPELVRELFESEARGTKIVIASRDNETELYAIDGLYRGQAGSDATIAPLRQLSPVILRQPSIVQGSLF
jgi:phosphoribosyl 1,2-cyclic phosphodiesterase